MCVWPSADSRNRASRDLVAAEVLGFATGLLVTDLAAEQRGSTWVLGPEPHGEAQAAAGSLGLAARRGPLPSTRASAAWA